MWRAGEYWGGGMLQVGGWTDLMLTFHIDWLLSLDESILTTDKYLNWILSNGDTDNENWVDTTVHNWDDLKLWDNFTFISLFIYFDRKFYVMLELSWQLNTILVLPRYGQGTGHKQKHQRYLFIAV